MKLTITMDMDNAAFEGDWSFEAARILRNYVDRLDEQGRDEAFNLRDVNGNTVGYAKISDDEPEQSVSEEQEALEAICARINGEYDHPVLRRFGPLAQTNDDVLRIAHCALGHSV